MRTPERLSSRLTFYFVALFLLTIGGIIALTLWFANRTLETSLDEDLQGTASTAAERLAESGNPQDVVDELSTGAQLLEVLDGNSNVLASSASLGGDRLPTFLGGVVRRNDGLHTIRFRRTEVRMVRHALVQNDQVTGYILVGDIIPHVDERIWDLAIILLITGGVGLAFAVGGTVFVSRRESAPLRELTDLALQTTDAGFEQSIPPSDRGSLETRELRKALAALVESQRQLLSRERAFFADSSHVLRTPLAVLKGDIEMLEQGVYGKERQEIVAQAHSAIDTMSRAVSGLLLLSRESDGAGSSWEVLDLEELLTGLVAEARTASPGLTFESSLASGLEVAGDAHQLRDLFASLIENSCHYTQEGGAVRVAARRTGEADAVVEVIDTGIGLTDEEAARAFDRFYRGAVARRMFSGGAGLGLAIAARIARVHRGTLSIEPGPEGGTIARVQLPLVG